MPPNHRRTRHPLAGRGKKTAIEANGTFIVGTYGRAGEYGCYWARLRSLDTGDVIDNNVNHGPQVVQILPTDHAFLTRNCADWQKVG